MTLTAVAPDAKPRQSELLARVVTLAAELPLEELPELVGQLAHAQAIASLRVSKGEPATAEPANGRLLTVEDVASMLQISEANVYTRAKTDLKAAAVDVGPGQLRFDRVKLQRFIDARRRA